MLYLFVKPPFPVVTIHVPPPTPFPANQPTCLSYLVVYKHMSNMYGQRLGHLRL